MRWLDLSTQNIPIILLEKFMIHIISKVASYIVTSTFSRKLKCSAVFMFAGKLYGNNFFLWPALFLYRIAVMWSGVVQVYYYHWSCHYPCCREKGGLDSCSAVQLATCYTLGQLVSTL